MPRVAIRASPPASRRALRPAALQPPDGLVGVGAERAAAVGHDLGVGRQLGQPALELVERDRARALDVPGRVLVLRAGRRRARRRRARAVPAALRGRSCRRPRRGSRGRRARPRPGGPPRRRAGRATAAAPRRRRARSARACPRACACTIPAALQRLQVLGRVRRRLAARARQLFDAARRLGQQVEQLEPDRAGERLAHQRDRLEQRVLRLVAPSRIDYSIDRLIACQARIADTRSTCSSGNCSTTKRPAPPTCSAARRTGSSRSSTPTSTSSTTTSRSPKPQGVPIVAVFDTHVQADHVSGPAGAGRAHRRERLPARGRGRRVRPPSARRRRGGHARQHGDRRRSRRPATPLAHHAYLVTDHRRARRAVAGADRRRAAGRRRRPAGPARAR